MGQEVQVREVDKGARNLSLRQLEDFEQTQNGTASSSDAVSPSQRRGLLARLLLVEEAKVASQQNRSKKWFLTAIVAMCGAVGPFASGITLPILSPVAEEFNSTQFSASMSIALYMLAMAIFPLWWSSCSEQTGRRSVLLLSNLGFIIFCAISALSTSMGMFLASRFLTGAVASSALSVGAGVVADLWEPRERGKAMGYFFLGPLCGPLIAPVVGGSLSMGLGWRSSLWFLTIYGAFLVILITVGLPETSAALESKPVQALPTDLLENKMPHTVGYMHRALLQAERFFVQPLRILTYLRFPAIALTVYLHSVTFGALYVINISTQYVFSREPYSFPTWLVGFTYAPASVGFVLTSILGGPWADRIMHREAVKANRIDENGRPLLLPEDRMRENAWIGIVMYPMALIWFGWAAEKGLMWVAVLIPPFFFGVGTFLLVSMSLTMLTEFMPGRSASGVAINNFVRNIFSFVGSLVAVPWIDAIGNGWVMTIVGIWGLSSALCIWLIRKFGSKWRDDFQRAMQ